MSKAGKWVLENAEVDSSVGDLYIDLSRVPIGERTELAMKAFALKIRIQKMD